MNTDDVAQGMAIGTDGTILVAGYSELDDPMNGEKSLAVTQFTRYGKNHGTWLAMVKPFTTMHLKIVMPVFQLFVINSERNLTSVGFWTMVWINKH